MDREIETLVKAVAAMGGPSEALRKLLEDISRADFIRNLELRGFPGAEIKRLPTMTLAHMVVGE